MSQSSQNSPSSSSQNSPSSSPQISSPQVVPGTPLTPATLQVVVPGTPQNSSPPPRDPFLSYESQFSSSPGTLETVQRSASAQQPERPSPRQLDFNPGGGSRRKSTLLLKRRKSTKSKKSKKLKSKSKRNKMQNKKSNRRRHI